MLVIWEKSYNFAAWMALNNKMNARFLNQTIKKKACRQLVKRLFIMPKSNKIVRTVLSILLFLSFSLRGSAQTSDISFQIHPQDEPHDNCLICNMDVSVKTNGLYDLALVPNIGLEFSLKNHWSLGLDYIGSWWWSDKRHRYWQCYGGYFTIRRYFSNYPTLRRGEGGAAHHVGLYLSALTYDVEWGGRGYQAARFGFGFGMEYGYSLPIAKRLNLDFTLGIGFQDGEYKEYLPTYDGTGHYVWQSTHKRHWFGPTKAEVSLVWLLWKGGKR